MRGTRQPSNCASGHEADAWLRAGGSGHRRRQRTLRGLVRAQSAGGMALVVATAVALAWANGPWQHSYDEVWGRPARLWLVGGAVPDVRAWIDQGLLTVFFLVAGLEIGRERVAGGLRSVRRAALPVLGAAGGMVGTAAVYVLAVHGGPGARGWGVPMATDIAFSLGALAVLGEAVPEGLRLFLLTLAIADDVGSVVVLAVGYATTVHVLPLLGAVAVVLAVAACRRWLAHPAWYALATAGSWVLLALAGIEPPLAGAFVGVLVPMTGRTGAARPPGLRLEARLAPVSAFAVLPLFALANAGVTVRAGLLGSTGALAVFLAVVVARVAGKTLGITGTAVLSARARVGRLPPDTGWAQLVGGSAMAAVGFTVPLLFANVAFGDRPDLLSATKAALVVASVVAFAIGAPVLAAAWRFPRRSASPRAQGHSGAGASPCR